MDYGAFLNSELFGLVILPLLIFLSRIIDVSIGTIRIIFVARGMKLFAPLLGFFEVLIWLLAIGQIMNNLTHLINYIAYAAGFAAGNYIGIIIEEKLAVGLVSIRIITNKDATECINFLKCENFGVTNIAARGVNGEVNLIFSIVKRKDLKKAVEIIKKFNPKAFIAIEDIRSVNEGVFPPEKSEKNYLNTLKFSRKGK